MENSNDEIIPTKISKLDLKFLPGYATFLLQNHLEDFVKELIITSRDEEVPLLKFFASYSDKELVELGKTSNIELLSLLEANKLQDYIDKSTVDFIQNRLPNIDRGEVLAEDITLVSFVRRKVLRNFLSLYTSDPVHFKNVMVDVDRFTAATEVASFNAYLNVQQENITRINQELANQQQELLEAQNLAEMGSFFWDMKHGNSFYTPNALAIFGLSKPTTLPDFFECVHPADRAKLKAAMDRAFKEDGQYECEYTYIKNNTEKRIWSRGNVKFEDGEPSGMKGTIMDITKKYKLLQQLQQSEELHKQAQALTHIGNWSWDIDNNTILWSDEMYRIYGLEPQSEEITFERFMSFVHPDHREQRVKEIEQALETLHAADYYLQIIAADGSIKMLKGKGEVITGPGNKPLKLNGTCQDVTREYLLNKVLQEKEQNFKQLINNAPDAIIVIDLDSNITLWNPKTTEIFGWTSEEVAGKPLKETIIPPRYRQAHEQGMKRFLSTGESHILNKTLELTALNKQQEEFYISLTISQTMQNGQIAFIAFLRDISVQKNTQLELLKKTNLLEFKNQELERVNEELESFNFAASHDLQEPLRKIQTYSSRIIDKAKEILPAPLMSDFNKIMTAAARMQKLIQDLLSFSQNTLTSQDAEPVDLDEMIEEVKNSFLTDVEEKKVRIIVDPLPIIKVVRFQFLQLFINLLSNAIKYQQPGIPPVIKISSAVIPSSNMGFNAIFPSANYLRICVADNGIGFEKEYSEKIFDLFTRLHGRDKYSGTGIGLATCKKIIHNHQGFIKTESRLGTGSSFLIYLPEETIIAP